MSQSCCRASDNENQNATFETQHGLGKLLARVGYQADAGHYAGYYYHAVEGEGRVLRYRPRRPQYSTTEGLHRHGNGGTVQQLRHVPCFTFGPATSEAIATCDRACAVRQYFQWCCSLLSSIWTCAALEAYSSCHDTSLASSDTCSIVLTPHYKLQQCTA